MIHWCRFFGILVMLSAFLCSTSMQAQEQTTQKPKFDVVSIKATENCGNAAPGLRVKIPGGTRYQPGGRFYTCTLLKYLIREVYQIDISSQLSGVPGWTDDVLYIIEAKAEGDPDKDQMRLMVQSLLEEKFKLKMRSEGWNATVYSLVVAKGGPKLQPAKDEKGNVLTSLPPLGEDDKKRLEEVRKRSFDPSEIMSTIRPGGYVIMGSASASELIGKAMTMETLSSALIGIAGGRKVINKTWVTGFYDIRLNFSDPQLLGRTPQNSPEAIPIPEPSAPGIFAALQGQLGLQLVEEKAPAFRFIVENLEKPPEN